MTTEPARQLRNVLEPLAANVYFAPEALDRYTALGLDYFAGYFCSRSACMGRLTGETVAAVFGVFNPDVVVPSVDRGWAATEPEALLEARQAGATRACTRILREANGGTLPDGVERATELLRQAGEATAANGHPIHAGLRSQGWPGDAVGDLWRAADLLREYWLDNPHNAARVAGGVDAVEITLLTRFWLGHPAQRLRADPRGFTDEQRADAVARLQDRGLLDGEAITDAGRAAQRPSRRPPTGATRPCWPRWGTIWTNPPTSPDPGRQPSSRPRATRSTRPRSPPSPGAEIAGRPATAPVRC